jgi:hypothetical protein
LSPMASYRDYAHILFSPVPVSEHQMNAASPLTGLRRIPGEICSTDKPQGR